MVPTLPPSSQLDTRRFRWLTLGMLALLLGTALFYRIPEWCGPRLNRELWVWPLTFALLGFYWQGFQLLQRHAVSRQWIWISGVLLALAAVAIPPFHSTDIYGYINRGWQQLHYGMNPYVFTVDHIPGWEADPMITDHWVNNPSPYGFLYLLVAKALCVLGAGNKALTVMLFKVWNGVLHLGTAWLVGYGAQALSEKGPDAYRGKVDPLLAIFLYLWNPLVLMQSLANGHNDSLMGFWVTLSAVAAITGRWVWILPALMAATLVKYGAVVIVPLAVLFLVRNRAWSALLQGLALSLILFGVTGLPFLADWRSFHLQEINRNAFVSHGSLHSLIFSMAKTLDKTLLPALHAHRDWVRTMLKNILLGSYALFFLRMVWLRWRQADYLVVQWIRDSLLVMLILVCLISLKFYPWYLGMFFPLVFFLRQDDWLFRSLLVLSGAQLFAITLIGQAHMLNFIVMTGLPVLWAWTQWRKAKAAEGVA